MHDQPDGSPRSTYDLYEALRRDRRQVGLKHACCPPLTWARLSRCAAKGSKMAYSRTHSAGFPGTHAGSDECYVFVSEIRSVKLWGLCTGAAARGRDVPLSEVHQD